MKHFYLFILFFSLAFLISCNYRTIEGQQATSDQQMNRHLYVCPMDSNVTSEEPGNCPKCGMELVEHNSMENNPKYAMNIKFSPSNIDAKQNVSLILTPEEIDKPTAIVPLDVVHEKKIHLILVSSDLSWFAHIHPILNADNNYVVDTKFPNGGSFILFADYQPTGATNQTTRFLVTVEGNNLEAKKYAMENLVWKGDDGYDVAFSFTNTEKLAGKHQVLTAVIRRNGTEVTDLDNYLGALGHLVIISEDTQHYLHVHPMESSLSGPTIGFLAEFESSGVYRAFLQFNHAGKIHTADFVIVINE